MDGFLQIRRGIEEHLLKGSLSYCDLGIFVTILLQANYRTGQWWGSAPRLAATATRGASLRNIQRSIEHLETLGFLKVFREGQGTRGNYGVLINKFEPTIGKHKGKRLCAAISTDYDNPAYVDADETLSERPDDAEESLSRLTEDGEHAPIQEEKCKRESEKEKTRSKAIASGQIAPIHFQHLQRQRNDTEAELTRYFHDSVQDNPYADSIPPKWETLWRRDIADLLDHYSDADLRDIIRSSQTPKWQKYVVRGAGLKKMAESILAGLRREAEAAMSDMDGTPADNEPSAFDIDDSGDEETFRAGELSDNVPRAFDVDELDDDD